MIEDAMTSNARAAPDRVRHVVFDGNGALLDDCALAVAPVDTPRDAVGLPRITRARYRGTRGVPIFGHLRELDAIDRRTTLESR